MAGAPTPTARTNPAAASIMEKNGFRSKITFAQEADVKWWEVSVTMPGFDGGPPVPLGNMYWAKFEPKVPRGLATMTESRMTVQMDVGCLPALKRMLNREDVITHTFPSGRKWAYYGYLRQTIGQEYRDGTQVLMQVVIEPTTHDGSADGTNWANAEQPPLAYTSANVLIG